MMAVPGSLGKTDDEVRSKIEQVAARGEKTDTGTAWHRDTKMNRLQRSEVVMENTPDAEAVRALCQQLMDGWNAGSGDGFAAPFADECDFIAFDGVRFRNRQDIARFHAPLFETHLKGTRLVGEVTDVRFLTPDVVVMHATGGTIPRGGTRPAPERASVQTLVAARQDGVWRLVAFQNTRVRPIGRNAAGTVLWLLSDRLWRWCLPHE